MTTRPNDRSVITGLVKQAALDFGFSQVGIAPAASPTGWPHFEKWLDAGMHGSMDYLASRREAYHHPSSVLEGVRSVIMLALDYQTAEPIEPMAGQGRVSRYAWGTTDYHTVIRDKLHALADRLRDLIPEALTRGIVDTAPLLERDFARAAGLGWQGKNTLLLSRTGGSWFFLAALLTDAELDYDQPHATDHCGTCRACLDACPTQAFPQPHVLDARRCISYLTIENRGPIDPALRSAIGDWVFGCDVCQEVCPWQSKSRTSAVEQFEPVEDLRPLELLSLFDLDEAGFRKRFRQTPLWRAHREGLLRNAAIVLGNQRSQAAVPALIKALSDTAPNVRGAAVWALKQIGDVQGLAAIQELQATETHAEVRAEF